MAKDILHGFEALQKLESGIKKLSKAVKLTLGPKGKNVVLDRKFATPLITNDGVTIAKEIELADKFENMGASLIKEVSIKTNDLAGDGTTTACVLAEALILEGIKNYAAGANPVMLKQGILKACELVVNQIEQQSTPVKTAQEIFQIASISAGNTEVGELISKAFDVVGKNGVILVEDGKTFKTELKIIQGMQFDRGYLSPYMVTNADTAEALLENCYILVTQEKISNINQIIGLLEQVSNQNKSLLIIADEIDGDVLATLVLNKLRGNLNSVAVKSPAYADRRVGYLQDICALTNATLISSELGNSLSAVSLEHLGSASKIKITKDSTIISGGNGNPKNIEKQVESINNQIENATSDFDKEQLYIRLAKLTSGIATICVGSTTEPEMQELKLRIEDAISATKSAIADGIVAGGGSALVRCISPLNKLINMLTHDQKTGAEIVREALSAPLKQIAENCGVNGGLVLDKVLKSKNKNFGYDGLNNKFVDMVSAGIIDPTRVTKSAITNACSVASILLTTSCLVSDCD